MLEHEKVGHVNPPTPPATQSGPPRLQVSGHQGVSKQNQSIFNCRSLSTTSSANNSFISTPPEMETPAPSSSSPNPSLDEQMVNVEKEWEDYKSWASTAAHEGMQFSVTWLLDLWKVHTVHQQKSLNFENSRVLQSSPEFSKFKDFLLMYHSS